MKLSLAPVAARRGFGGVFYTSSSACTYSRSSFTRRSQYSLCRRHPSRRNLSNTTAFQTSTSPKPSEEPPASQSRTSATHLLNFQNLKSTPAPSISEHVRLLMRRVPYPVAIITATDPNGPPDTTSFRGMTVSSFNTVTLSPHPVISFNVRRPSETLNALLASGRFLVHLLAPGPATSTLARDFSKGNTTLASMLSGHGEFEFGALSVEPEQGSSKPLPILRRRAQSSEKEEVDFPFVFECTLHPSKIDVHDHSIILGTVVRAIEGSDTRPSGEQTGAQASLDEHSPEHLCLTYANTRFWKMGSEL